MCRAISCKRCHKPTWAGCGAHVEQVLGHVPADERCSCSTNPPPAEAQPATGGWLRRLQRR